LGLFRILTLFFKNINQLLKDERNRRTQATYSKKPENKIARAEYNATIGCKITKARYDKGPKGRINKRKRQARYEAKNPERLKSFIAKAPLLNPFKTRVSQPKKLNKAFAIGQDTEEVRSRLICNFEPFAYFAQGIFIIYSLLLRIQKVYSAPDSTAINYIYLYFDTTLWTDSMTFKQWLQSIFYVGRGIGARCVDHARDTQSLLNDKITIDEKKVRNFCVFLYSFHFFGSPRKRELQRFGRQKRG
jgi:hypothetical protein